MIVGVPKETAAGERRVALVPDAVKPLKAKGIELLVQTGAGEAAGFADAAYVQAGATLEADLSALVGRADVIAKVQGPARSRAPHTKPTPLRAGQVLIGALRPLDQPELAARLAQRRVTAFALELVPRITRAQAMDVLVVAGHGRRLQGGAARRAALGKIFPMLMTAAGTISPRAGAGDGRRRGGPAGHRHRAAARRGGRRPSTCARRCKEQVQSLGATFVEVAARHEDAQDAGGYARAQSRGVDAAPARAARASASRASDVVITTALVPGRARAAS